MSQVLPELAVRDMAESLAFYTGVVGFEVVETVEVGGDTTTWAELALGDGRLMLQRCEDLLAEFPVLLGREVGGTGLVVVRFADARQVRSVAARAAAVDTPILSGPLATDYGTVDLGLLDPDRYVVVCSGRTPTEQPNS